MGKVKDRVTRGLAGVMLSTNGTLLVRNGTLLRPVVDSNHE
jgi:hypothetical protein